MILLPRGGGQAPALLLDNRCGSELARTEAAMVFSLVAQVCNLRPLPTCPRTGTHFPCTSRLSLLDNRCGSELARTEAEMAFSSVAQVCNLRPPPTCPRTGTHFPCTPRLSLRTDYGAGFARK